jgi:protein-arginine kinase activator protein McsA
MTANKIVKLLLEELSTFPIVQYAKLEEETFKVVKGDVETNIVCKFNKEGYLVSMTSSSKPIEETSIMKSLKDDLHAAIDEENFEKAAEIQKQINKLRQVEENKTKPTL